MGVGCPPGRRPPPFKLRGVDVGFCFASRSSGRRCLPFDGRCGAGRAALRRGAWPDRTIRAGSARRPIPACRRRSPPRRPNGTKPFRILVTRASGTSRSSIDKPFVHLIGEDRKGSVISHLAASGLTAPDGKKWGTFRTPTLFVRAPDFSARKSDHPERLRRSGRDEQARRPAFARRRRPQAVALMLDKGSDRARLTEVDILSYQDTLFPDAGRSLFERCLITGSYDFIFGAGGPISRAARSARGPARRPDRRLHRRAQHADRAAVRLRLPRCRLTKEAGTKRRQRLSRPALATLGDVPGRSLRRPALCRRGRLPRLLDGRPHRAGRLDRDVVHGPRRQSGRTMLQPEDAPRSQDNEVGPGVQKSGDPPWPRRGRAFLSVAGLSAVGASVAPAASAAIAKAPAPKAAKNPLAIDPRGVARPG
jgi:pectinesterase